MDSSDSLLQKGRPVLYAGMAVDMVGTLFFAAFILDFLDIMDLSPGFPRLVYLVIALATIALGVLLIFVGGRRLQQERSGAAREAPRTT